MFAACAMFSGCAATNISEPIEMGNGKYQVNHILGNASDIAPKAQQFCRAKGYAYAEVTGTYNNADFTGNHTTFFCMNNGDTLTQPIVAPIIMMPW